MRLRIFATMVLITVSSAGCNPSTPGNKSNETSKKSEEEIKQGFTALQSAIKSKDVGKIWSLLAKDSQDDAEREAKAVKEALSKLAGPEREAYEKKVGLTAAELTEMTGKTYVQSKSFFTGDVDELPDSKLEKIVVTGESATLFYAEEKGEKEKLAVVREQGQWKFAVPVPKAVLK